MEYYFEYTLSKLFSSINILDFKKISAIDPLHPSRILANGRTACAKCVHTAPGKHLFSV